MDTNTPSSAPGSPPPAEHLPPGAPVPPGGPAPGGQVPPGQAPPPAPGQSGMDAFFDAIRRTGLVRSQERWIGGVAGGIALRLGVDALVVRGVLAVTVLFGGLGLILYGLGWALLPEQRDGRIHLQQLFRGDFDAAVIGAFVVFASGLSFPDRWNPGMWWGGDRSGAGGWAALLWLSAVAVVVLLVVSATRSTGRGPSTGLPRQPYPPTYPMSDTSRGADMSQSTAPFTPPPGGPAPYAGGPSFTGPAPTAQAYQPAGYPGPATAYPTPPPPPAPGQGWGPGGPAGPLPPVGGRPPQPPAALPRPRPSGPGAATTGVVVALTLITLAVLMLLERTGRFEGPVLLTAVSVGVVVAGITIVIAGLRGRTSGTLGFLAVVGILSAGPALAITQNSWQWYGSNTTLGELTHAPQTVAEAEEGYSLGAGEARIDLTEVPLGGDPVDIPINVGAGELRIVIPEGSAVEADVTIFAGELDWLGEKVSGVGGGGSPRYETPAVDDGAEPDLVLDITVGAGTVIVVED